MATLLFIITTIISLGGNPFAEECHVYPKATTVVEVDLINDLVYVMDSQGDEWSFYGAEGWEVDDLATLVMYNNMTCEDNFDDVILFQNYEKRVDR